METIFCSESVPVGAEKILNWMGHPAHHHHQQHVWGSVNPERFHIFKFEPRTRSQLIKALGTSILGLMAQNREKSVRAPFALYRTAFRFKSAATWHHQRVCAVRVDMMMMLLALPPPRERRWWRQLVETSLARM